MASLCEMLWPHLRVTLLAGLAGLTVHLVLMTVKDSLGILPDPGNPGRIFAASHQGAVFVSEDGGRNWSAFAGAAGQAR